MRWISRLTLLLLAAWVFYAASPYFALYGLAKAVEARDVAAIEERVSFRAVRISIARQIVTAYLDAKGQSVDPASLRRQATVGAGATIADPLVAQLVSAEALIDLLDDGWPQAVAKEKTASIDGVDLKSLGSAWRLFVNSESRGFRTFIFAVPDGQPPQERFKLQFRLVGLTWKLTGIELPASLRQRLVQELPKDIG